VPGTSADKPSTAGVPVLDPAGDVVVGVVAVAQAAAGEWVRVVADCNPQLRDEVGAQSVQAGGVAD